MRAVEGSGVIHEQFERLFSRGTLAGRSDRDLLNRFATGRDEGAFEALVARHGPLVLAVCRSATGDRHLAEDAFQATFLILARKAGSIRVDDSLGRWLRGVARRVATRSAVQESKRRAREGLPLGPIAIAPDRSAELEEARVLLHQEIARLPAADRDPVRACYLDGQTCAEAARQLGLPIGTLKGRLARVRARLRERLARRGLDAPAVLPVRWAVPEPLIDATVRAARIYTKSGLDVAGVVPATVATLANWGVFRMMIVSRLKASALALALIGAGAAGAVGLASTRSDDGPPVESTKSATPAEARPPTEGSKVVLPEYVVEPPDILTIKLKDSSQIDGDRLVRPDGTISLDYYGSVFVSGLTLREIKEKIILQLRKNFSDEALGLVRDEGRREVVVESPGAAPTVRYKGGRSVAVAPADSSKLYVDVSGYNSKVYYVLGDVAVPGRFPITGTATVLDAIQQAGGLLPTASKSSLRLIRPVLNGARPAQKLPIDLAAIEQGGTTTNYQLMPGDRLYVDRDPKAATTIGEVHAVIYDVADLMGPRTVPSGTRTIPADPNPLTDLIRSTIAPGTWSEGPHADSGKPGSITPDGTRLIIRQTPAVHDEIQKLINHLNRIVALQRPGSASAATGPNPPASAGDRLERLESRVAEILQDLKQLKRERKLDPPGSN